MTADHTDRNAVHDGREAISHRERKAQAEATRRRDLVAEVEPVAPADPETPAQ
jgi:hypothetical protein